MFVLNFCMLFLFQSVWLTVLLLNNKIVMQVFFLYVYYGFDFLNISQVSSIDTLMHPTSAKLMYASWSNISSCVWIAVQWCGVTCLFICVAPDSIQRGRRRSLPVRRSTWNSTPASYPCRQTSNSGWNLPVKRWWPLLYSSPSPVSSCEKAKPREFLPTTCDSFTGE